MISLDHISYTDVMKRVANRVKHRRLEINLTQEGLAERAGIKLPTYRMFERTGKISFEGLMKIAFALNAMDDFELLFSQRKFNSIEDVINDGASPTPKRGKIK